MKKKSEEIIEEEKCYCQKLYDNPWCPKHYGPFPKGAWIVGDGNYAP